MAPKTKSPKEQPKPVSEALLKRLPTKISREIYEMHMVNRFPLPERGFVMQNMHPNVLEWFTALQWETLMHQPPFILLDLTREIYAGIPHKSKIGADPTFSIVRGKKVSFCAERINEVLKLPQVEDQFEDLVNNATEADLERAKRSLCVADTEWVPDKPNVFKVRRTAQKGKVKDLSLWIMSSFLPTTHNLYWHKERLLLLEAMVLNLKINVGKLMEREILICARRTVGSLFYPNLIRLLCEYEEVDHFDDQEEEYPLASEVDLKYGVARTDEVEEEKKKEKKKKGEEKKGNEKEKAVDKGDNVPYDSIAEVLLFLQLHMKKEEAVWQFLKEVHAWYINVFAEAVVPPPQFPNWVLSGAGPSEPATAASAPLKKKKASATPMKKPVATTAPKPGDAAKATAASKGKAVMMDEDDEQENQGSSNSAKAKKSKLEGLLRRERKEE